MNSFSSVAMKMNFHRPASLPSITTMKNKIVMGISSLMLGIVLGAGGILTASAQVGMTTTSPRNAGRAAAQETRLQNIMNRANQEITRRSSALNALDTRMNAMRKLSSDEKNGLSSEIQGRYPP